MSYTKSLNNTIFGFKNKLRCAKQLCSNLYRISVIVRSVQTKKNRFIHVFSKHFLSTNSLCAKLFKNFYFANLGCSRTFCIKLFPRKQNYYHLEICIRDLFDNKLNSVRVNLCSKRIYFEK